MKLGIKGPDLPSVGFGCMGLGGRYERDDSQDEKAISVIRSAFDMGLRLFDTAEVYGAGYGEEVLGRAIVKDRADVFISSKFSASNAAYDDVISACEGSLRRLGTDYIDLYQCHWPNPDIPFEETLNALSKLRENGKIRYAGFSNVTPAQLRNILAEVPAGLDVVSVQQDYSLIERFAEHKMLPFCQENDVTLIAYSPLGQGRVDLSGGRKELLDDLSSTYNASHYAIMLAWVIYQQNVMAIPMTSNVDHLKSNLSALSFSLNEGQYNQLSDAFSVCIEEIDTNKIEVLTSHTGKAFKTRAEAEANSLNLSPSPQALTLELKDGDMLKPVKVRPKAGHPGYYELYEGQLRFWGWVLAFDGQKAIPALIEEKHL